MAKAKQLIEELSENEDKNGEPRKVSRQEIQDAIDNDPDKVFYDMYGGEFTAHEAKQELKNGVPMFDRAPDEDE